MSIKSSTFWTISSWAIWV